MFNNYSSLLQESIHSNNHDKFFQDVLQIVDLMESPKLVFSVLDFFKIHQQRHFQFFQAFFENVFQLSNSNDSKIFYIIGVCFEIGCGTEKSFSSSFQFYEKAARLKSLPAINNVANFYTNGRGRSKDPQRAFGLYHQAAIAGFPIAINNLGWCYENGKGVQKDIKKAFDLYSQAAEMDYSHSMYSLASLYLSEYHEVEKNYIKAFQLLQKAATFGNPRAYFRLFQVLPIGIGVERNYPEAINFLTKAANMGDEFAFISFGIYLLLEEKNYDEAFKFLSANPGNHCADRLFWFGFCLLNGIGTKQKYRDGYELIQELNYRSQYLPALQIFSITNQKRHQYS